MYNYEKYIVILFSILTVGYSQERSKSQSRDFPVTSVGIQAQITSRSQQQLYDAVVPGFEEVNTLTREMKCHFHVNDCTSQSKRYHITVGIFKSSNPEVTLFKSDTNNIWSVGKVLQKNIKEYNKCSHIYGIYLFAHGYDRQGNLIDTHYASSNKAKKCIHRHFNVDEGDKLTHFHIVARHGTSQKGEAIGLFASDCQKIVGEITTQYPQYVYAHEHINNGQYVGHITLAVGKKKAGLITPESKGFGKQHYSIITEIYEKIEGSYKSNTQNSGGEIDINFAKFYTTYR